MGRLMRIITLIATAGSVAGAQARDAHQSAPKATVDQLSWLSGCWQGGKSRETSEQWTPPAGGTLLGVSRTIAEGRTVAYEFLRIWQNADGTLVLTALPSGQREASFTLITSGAQEAVFENPEHDYPQRVIYRRTAPDALLGRIEGTLEGKERATDFPMTRVPCL